MVLLHLSILLLLLNKEEYYHQMLKQMIVVPVPANSDLAVLKLAGEVVQVEPSYSSVAPVIGASSSKS
jgi:hypothetical protein